MNAQTLFLNRLVSFENAAADLLAAWENEELDSQDEEAINGLYPLGKEFQDVHAGIVFWRESVRAQFQASGHLNRPGTEPAVDNSWLTEVYLKSMGYHKVKDDGQYGEYNSDHLVAVSQTYGSIPEDYRTIKFNRDAKYGVFFSVQADWGTRYSVKQVLATSREIFEAILNACA